MNRAEKFVDYVEWNFAKRVVLGSALDTRFAIGALCVVAVLAISGPFETVNTLNLAQRFAYWLPISVGSYFIALYFGALAFARAELFGWKQPFPCIASAVTAGIPVGLFVYFVNTLIVGNMAGGWGDFFYIQMVSIVITTSGSFLHNMLCQERVLHSDAPKESHNVDLTPTLDCASIPSIMDRLSPQNRGEIYFIRAQDHYVEVSTSRGKELILMRFSDAISELSTTAGKQVHRSWWVSKAAVTEVVHDGDRVCLALKGGCNAPVSRANEGIVKAWLGFYAST